jgi:hypothetical protein
MRAPFKIALWLGLCFATGIFVSRAIAARANHLTADMVKMGFMMRGISISPGTGFSLQDSDGKSHNFRMDTFSVNVRAGHVTIEMDTTQID